MMIYTMNMLLDFKIWDEDSRYFMTSKQSVCTKLREIIMSNDGIITSGLQNGNCCRRECRYIECQFTGFHDDNEDKIYNHDILLINDDRKVVSFKNGSYYCGDIVLYEYISNQDITVCIKGSSLEKC